MSYEDGVKLTSLLLLNTSDHRSLRSPSGIVAYSFSFEIYLAKIKGICQDT
jgi:hypothetical protein